jgi:integrase
VSLRLHFGDTRLSHINPERIDEFKEARLADNVRAATVNRDLAVLRQMLKIAERKRLINVTPFREIEMLEERKERRQPHILTFDEEKRLLATAADHIRVLATLILETGLRSGKEALALKWADIDFLNESIRVRQSKTLAGLRILPMSNRCSATLLRWQGVLGLGTQFLRVCIPKARASRNASTGCSRDLGKRVECCWIKTILDLRSYDLRHTFCSRVIQTGVSHIFVAQMMGHSSSSSILQTYAKAIDEYKRSAISKLEALRASQVGRATTEDDQNTRSIQ